VGYVDGLLKPPLPSPSSTATLPVLTITASGLPSRFRSAIAAANENPPVAYVATPEKLTGATDADAGPSANTNISRPNTTASEPRRRLIGLPLSHRTSISVSFREKCSDLAILDAAANRPLTASDRAT